MGTALLRTVARNARNEFLRKITEDSFSLLRRREEFDEPCGNSRWTNC
jgi:hypothetical protein